MLKKYLLSSVARFPETEGAAPPPPPDEGQRETLAFDPSTFFAPPATEGQDGGEGEDPALDGGGDAGAAAGAASTAKAAPTSSEPDPALAKTEGEGPDPLQSIRDAVAGFLEKKPVAEQQAAQQTTPAKEPTEQPKQPATEDVKYEMSVPDEIVEALANEEPRVRKQALNALVNGISNKLAKDFGNAMAVMARHVQEQAVQAALGQVDNRTNEQKVRDDFYNNNADLKELVNNLPALDAVVWQTTQQIATATGAKGWSPQLRDQVAATLRLQLKLPTAAPAKAAPTAPAPRKASFNAGGGGPSSGRPNGAADQNEFMSVLGAGT